MKSFQSSKEEKVTEQGRAIARGIAEQNAQKERNMAKAEKREKTILANQAEKFISGK